MLPGTVLTRRDLLDRAEARLRARGGEEGALEASRCFLRAMLVGIDDTAPVPDDLVARVGEFPKLDLSELTTNPALRRVSTQENPTSRPIVPMGGVSSVRTINQTKQLYTKLHVVFWW